MIPAAGLLLLIGLALFGAGLLTGATALYWSCVAVCATAAGLLVLARRRIAAGPAQRVAGQGASSAPVAPSAALPSWTGSAAAGSVPAGTGDREDPPAEEVEVSDLLLLLDVTSEVLVVDERPRYHVAGCAWLGGRSTVPLPLDEARTDGFTPCGACRPDRTLAERIRARR